MSTTIHRHADQEDAARASLGRPALTRTANDSEIGPEIYPATFYVVRVNNDPLDTHAGASLEDALQLAMPDAGDRIDFATVQATDAGAARLMKPSAWKRYACAVLAALLSLPAFADPCKVNVNAATPAELQLFSRTGPVLAARLASGRPYRHLKAVDAVKGVGEAWLSVNGPHVAFAGPTTCKEKIHAPKIPKVAAQDPKL